MHSISIANEFTPDNLPEGYQSVLGYFADTNPEALYLLPSPLDDCADDLNWLTGVMNNRGTAPAMVRGPKGYVDLGVTEVPIFPLALLEERLGYED